MRSRWLILFAMLSLLLCGTLLAQGKVQSKGRGEAREEATEVERPERTKKSKGASRYKHGKAHQKHAKKNGATKGEKKEQYRAISHKNPEKH